jgi:large subunit ribosomal protein L24
MQRLQTGDNVIIISGAHKGKTGKVKRLIQDEDRVVVEGVNVVKRSTKPTPNRAGGIVQKEAPLHVSNVALVDPETGKATRVKHRVEEGKKVRVAKSGAVIKKAQ